MSVQYTLISPAANNDMLRPGADCIDSEAVDDPIQDFIVYIRITVLRD
jgi:hypothetical protein